MKQGEGRIEKGQTKARGGRGRETHFRGLDARGSQSRLRRRRKQRHRRTLGVCWKEMSRSLSAGQSYLYCGIAIRGVKGQAEDEWALEGKWTALSRRSLRAMGETPLVAMRSTQGRTKEGGTRVQEQVGCKMGGLLKSIRWPLTFDMSTNPFLAKSRWAFFGSRCS